MIAQNMVKTKEAAKYEEIEICTPRLTHVFKAADISDVVFNTINGNVHVTIDTMDGSTHEFYGDISVHTVMNYKGV